MHSTQAVSIYSSISIFQRLIYFFVLILFENFSYAQSQESHTLEKQEIQVIPEKSSPQSAEDFVSLGKTYTQMELKGQAIEAYQKALELEPSNGDIKVALAYAYLFDQQLEKSLFLFQEIIQEHSQNVDALIGIGRIKKLQNHFTEAKEYYLQASSIDPHRQEIQTALTQLNELLLKEDKQQLIEKANHLVKEELFQEAIPIYQQLIKTDSREPDYVFQIGKLYVQLKQYSQAIEYLNRVLELKQDHEDAKIALAYVYLFEKNLKMSESLFETVLKQQPASVDALLGLGRVREVQGRYNEAKALYEQGLKIEPHHQEIQERLAHLHPSDSPKKKQPSSQENVVNSSQEQKSPSKLTLNSEEKHLAQEAKQRLDQKDYQQAIQLYLQLIRSQPNQADFHFLIGQAYSRSNQKTQAMAAFNRAIELNAEHQDARVSLAYLYMAEGNLEKSDALFRIVLNHSPKYVDAIVGLGRIKLLQKHPEEAKKLFQEALSIESTHQLAKESLMQLNGSSTLSKKRVPEWVKQQLEESKRLEQQQDFHQALCIYQKLVQAFPKNSDYLFKLGQLYTRIKQPQLAKEAFYQVLALDANHHDARSALAYLYLFDQDLSTSQLLFEMVLEIHPSHAEALAGLGQIAAKKRCLNIAEEYFVQALRQDANQVFALTHYGNLLREQKRWQFAKSTYLHLKELEPTDFVIPKILFDLRGYTDPSWLVKGTYAEEEERDQESDQPVARLVDWTKQIECILPVHDRLRCSLRVIRQEIKQINLLSKTNLYDAWIDSYIFKTEFFFTPKWTLSMFGNLTEAKNKSRKSILRTIQDRLFNPGILARYEDLSQRFYAQALYTPFLTRDFKKQRTYLIKIGDIGISYEKDFCYQSKLGSRADYYFYEDRVHNRAYWLTGWAQTGLIPFEENVAFRYQIDYRRFKKEVPDYYTFQYQLTHWLSLRYSQTWCDSWYLEAEFWHGWRWTKGKDPQSPLIPDIQDIPFEDLPITTVFSYIDRFVISLTKTFGDRWQVNLGAQGTRDSFDYTTWLVEGTVCYRF
jgi:tetratricopeptide (TPR) repeat protein